jgi:hypothetical protein
MKSDFFAHTFLKITVLEIETHKLQDSNRHTYISCDKDNYYMDTILLPAWQVAQSRVSGGGSNIYRGVSRHI